MYISVARVCDPVWPRGDSLCVRVYAPVCVCVCCVGVCDRWNLWGHPISHSRGPGVYDQWDPSPFLFICFVVLSLVVFFLFWEIVQFSPLPYLEIAILGNK